MKDNRLWLSILVLTLAVSLTQAVVLVRPKSQQAQEDANTSFKLKASPIKDTSKLITHSFASLSSVASRVLGTTKYDTPQYDHPETLKQEVASMRDSVLSFFNGLFRGLQNDLSVVQTECSISTKNLIDEMFINFPIYLEQFQDSSPNPQDLLLMFMSIAGNYQGFVKDCEIETIMSSVTESTECMSYKLSWRSVFNFTNMFRSLANLFTNLVTVDLYNTMIYFGDMLGILIAYEYSAS